MISVRSLLSVLAAALLGVAGCNQSPTGSSGTPGPSAEPASIAVAVVKPERTVLRRTVRQPGSLHAFEETLVFSKIPGYVEKWHVDRGAHVKGGDVLAELWVPEMEVALRQKEALVQQADAEIAQAKENAAAAEAGYRSGEAKVNEAGAARLRARAEQERTRSQAERLAQQGGVLAKESIEEAKLGYESAKAGVAEVEARIKSAEALRDESKAKADKARADVSVAESHLQVAKEDRDFAKTMLQYRRLTAPYDGVVTRRNVNTRDFVQPAAGNRGEPLFVVERRDIMRAAVEVPESDAGWVGTGAKAELRFQALPGQKFSAEVARTSYALDRTARTLVAEIDLPNPDDRLRPNMYVSTTITAEHADVMSLPSSAVLTLGDVTQGYQNYCFLVEDGKVRRTPVRLGARGDDRVEVLKRQAKPAREGEEGAWETFTGQEVVVRGNLSGLSDGQAVTVSSGDK